MRERPLFMGACAAILGSLGAYYRSVYVLSFFVLLLGYYIYGTIKARQVKSVLIRLLWLTGLFFLASFHLVKECSLQKTELSQLKSGEKIQICGELYRKELKKESCNYYLKDCSIYVSNQWIAANSAIAYLDTDDWAIGDKLLLTGKVNMFLKPTNEGQFDQQSFYFSQKIDFSLREAEVIDAQGALWKMPECLYQYRNRVSKIYEHFLKMENAGILSTMLLGKKDSLDKEEKEIYKAAGIAHILSISGMHVAILGMGLYRTLRRRGISYVAACSVSLFVLLLYVMMTGNGVSTLRAAIMLTASMLADVLGRTYDLLNALGLAVLLLLAENPFCLWYSGFQFSVVAVLGIGTFVKYLSIGNKTTKAIYASVGIYLVTLPLVAWNYYEVPVYSFVLNMLILPFLSVLFFLGILGGVIGAGVMSLGGLWEKILKIGFLPCDFILFLYDYLARFFERLPYAHWIVGRPSIYKIAAYYAMMTGLTYLFKKGNRGHLFRMACLLLLVGFFFFPQARKSEITMLDVGQGDGIYICTENGSNIFIDGGSSSIKGVGAYRILPFLKCKGVRNIDYWFVSHPDEDHISGLIEAFSEHYRIKYLVVAGAVVESNLKAFEELFALAEENDTEVILMNEGDSLYVGKEKLECIYPRKTESEKDRNDLSLVLLYESRLGDALFTGDISAQAEKKLLERYSAKMLDVDIYKVAHHGSRYSSSMQFIQALSPNWSLISCGKNSIYGHPHKETLERLKCFAPKGMVYRTDQCGQVTITSDEGEVLVKQLITE